MGLFKRSKNNDDDYILNYSPADDSVEDEIPVIDKDKVKAPHAMTIDEILGVKTEENQKEPQKAQELKEETPIVEEPKVEISKPKMEAPEIKTEEKSAAEKAQELIESLKAKNMEKPKAAPIVTEEPKVKAPVVEAPVVENSVPIMEHQKEETPVVENKAIQNSAPVKKETKLSPAAQALYDRMMAQRVKQQSAARAKEENKESIITDIKPVVPVTTPVSVVAPMAETVVSKTKDEIKKEENIADAIFNSLSSSLNERNPLSVKKNLGGSSLLSKCKNFVENEDDYTSTSIDDIIESAEKGARDRLSNFYDAQESDNFKRETPKYDFSVFTARHTGEIPTQPDAKNISIPIKIADETSDKAVITSSTGEIKNFQYSFADNSAKIDEYEDISSTRRIDIPEQTGHQVDPIKAEEWRVHLRALAEKEATGEIDRVKFTGTAEVELPEMEVPPFDAEPGQMDDYKSAEDAEGIRTDLASKKVSLMARLLATAGITALLFIFNFVIKEWLISYSDALYQILNIVSLIALCGINYNTIKGFSSMLFGAPDMDTPCALAVVTTTFYTIITALAGNMDTLPALAPVAALTLVFNLLGKLSILKRIRKGFELIVGEEKKNAVVFVEDNLDAAVMANGSVVGEALICQGRETRNIRDYLKNAYSEDLYEQKLKPFVMFTLIAAAVLAIMGFIAGGLSGGILALALVTCIACPPSSLFVCNLPFSFATNNLENYGAMIAGHLGAENISNANAVAFDAAELFPTGTIKLYNMQVLNKGAVDKYITAAAAVLKEAASPLSPIFEEMLEDSAQEQPTADSIKYENNMGVSGWIGEHRVFIGNRTLMEGHNIKVPSLELDRKILREGYFPVYLAFDQQLCALFIVGYEADRTITYELRRLCNTGVTMLVNSNDPNITDEMLCDYFGLYPDSIKVMNVTGVSAYKKQSAYRENISAPAAFDGSVCALLATVTSSIRMKSIIKILYVMQLVLICLGLAVSAYLLLTGALLSLSSLIIVLFQLILTGIIFGTAYLKQP